MANTGHGGPSNWRTSAGRERGQEPALGAAPNDERKARIDMGAKPALIVTGGANAPTTQTKRIRKDQENGAQ